MNRLPDVEPVLRAYLADTSDRAPDRVLVDVAARIARQPRRNAWRLRGRLFVNMYTKLAAGLAAVLVVALVGWQLVSGPTWNSGGQATPSPSPTPSPSQAASGPELPAEGALTGGRYLFNEFRTSSLRITASIPSGWQASFGWVAGPTGEEAPNGILVGFMLVDGLHEDPCHWDRADSAQFGQPGNVPVGPTAIDLVNALRASTAFTTIDGPKPLTIGGHEGQAMAIQPPAELNLEECDGGLLQDTHYYLGFSGPDATRARIFGQSTGNYSDLVIVDVEGTRVVALVRHFDGTPAADVDAARGIVESVEFLP